MKTLPFARAIAIALVASLYVNAAPTPVRAQALEAPRLVVFISIDQMRGDYITRYGHKWTKGLRRLVDDGALFVQSAYPYFNTVTCAGHATMGTGAFPSTHGMVLNAWWDRQAGKTVACTDDPNVSPINYGKAADPKAIGNSAHLLKTSTFADELRTQAGRAPHVVTLSMKPRSAINLAGHAGDVVLWYGGAEAGWQSSTAFAAGKVPFVEQYIAKHPIEHDFATPWTKAMPENAYLFDDNGSGEQPTDGWTPTFPHPIRLDPTDKGSATRWQATPYPDAYLGQLAAAAIDEFKLGQVPGTDYLGVSFSQLDAVGHPFGPRSHEVQDVLYRLDKVIGDLLSAIDTKVGAGRYVVALTGDHGVASVPEQMKALKIDAGRVNLKAVQTAVEETLTTKYGAAPNGKYVAYVAYTDLYFAPGVMDKLKGDPATLQAVIEVIERTEGIARVVPSYKLLDVLPADDRLMHAARLSYVPDRSGDLFLMPKPYWLMSSAGTTHGTGYGYDQRVPVLLFGAGIKTGKYWGPASPADLSPTLAALCGVTMARPDGRVLSEALAASMSAATTTARQGGSGSRQTGAGSR